MGNKTNIFLDYNATTPLRPQAAEAMLQVMGQPLNASSVHQWGRRGKSLLNHARSEIVHMLNGQNANLIFTASGTEANHLALLGLQQATHLMVSAVEHACVLAPAQSRNVTLIPVDAQGIVKLEALEQLLQQHAKEKILVSVMLANNETGVIQPLADIAQLVYRHGGFVHSDATQAIGKIPVDFTALNVDMMSISAHKFGGPQGVGALLVKKGIDLAAQLQGGGQESGFRAGTENIAGIVGMQTALADALANLSDSALRDALENALTHIAPEAMIAGIGAPRLPNTTCITMPNIKSEQQLIAFDLAGIAVSAGSACSSGRVTTSHVLKAMGWSDEQASCAIRISSGYQTNHMQIQQMIDVWSAHYHKQSRKQAA